MLLVIHYKKKTFHQCVQRGEATWY